jgi:hypothetical protein
MVTKNYKIYIANVLFICDSYKGPFNSTVYIAQNDRMTVNLNEYGKKLSWSIYGNIPAFA